jgi:hypothetical protein
MAWTAFRGATPESVVTELRRLLIAHGTTVDSAPADVYKASFEEDILIHHCPPWVVVKWPQYYDAHDLPLAKEITARLGCLASTNSVHCDDLWRHALVEYGIVLDEFANRPDFFCDSEEQAAPLRTRYRGSAEIVARAVGIDVGLVAPYFVHLHDGGEPVRAFPDDEWTVGEPWAFRELWKRFGIVLDRQGKDCVAGLRPGPDARKKLPSAGLH